MLERIHHFVLDTLFPINCLGCGQDGIWLCDKCFKKIDLLSFQVCPKCEKTITQSGLVCLACKTNIFPGQENFYLDGLLVTAKYRQSNLDKLIHLFKYNLIEDLHAPLGKLLIEALLKNNFPIPDMIIPVPLHNRRLRWRGFNQAELLARYISQSLTPGLPIPLENGILLRKKYTGPQMHIKKYSERQENLLDAFSVRENTLIKNKTVLLVDDISTTGSTLLECAKALKKAGAKKVFGIVLARQEMK
jgi:ComF family protein